MALSSTKKPPTKKASTKNSSTKQANSKVCENDHWTIVMGELKRSRGRPNNTQPIFKMIGEKIPFVFLNQVENKRSEAKRSTNGIYIAHDSMGYPRYIGRGKIFARWRRDGRRRFWSLHIFHSSSWKPKFMSAKWRRL